MTIMLYCSMAGPLILHDSPQFTVLAGRDDAGSSLQCPDLLWFQPNSLVAPQHVES